MRMLKPIILFFSVLLIAGAPVSEAAEELFDTKAAAELFEKGISHLKTKNLEAAVDALEESVSISPEAETYYYLGYAYYMKGRTGDSESRKRSIESFEKAYELDPNFTPSRFKQSEVTPQPEQNEQESGDAIKPIQQPSKSMLEAVTEPFASETIARQQKRQENEN